MLTEQAVAEKMTHRRQEHWLMKHFLSPISMYMDGQEDFWWGQQNIWDPHEQVSFRFLKLAWVYGLSIFAKLSSVIVGKFSFDFFGTMFLIGMITGSVTGFIAAIFELRDIKELGKSSVKITDSI